jgi:hypothetical protein
MTSLSVAVTVREAYGFAIRGFVRNLAVVWLPVVLTAALVILSLPPLLGGLAHFLSGLSGPHPDVLALAAGGAVFMRYTLLIAVGGLFFRAQIMTGLTQRALGQRTGFAGVYLSFGASFWRVFGAYVLIFLLLMAVQLAASLLLVLPTIILVGISHGAAGGGAIPQAGIAFVAFFILWRIALLVLVTYLFIRLTFVVTAVIVAEQRFDLIRAWQLVGGNVLRIFAVGLVVFVPLVLVLAALYGLLLGPELWTLVHSLAHTSMHGRRLAAALIQDIVGGVTQLLARRWFVLLPLALISVTLEYGLAAGAGVAGYRSLVSEGDGEGAAHISTTV